MEIVSLNQLHSLKLLESDISIEELKQVFMVKYQKLGKLLGNSQPHFFGMKLYSRVKDLHLSSFKFRVYRKKV